MVNVSPVGGPPGTVFTFSGFNFPANALVTYTISPAPIGPSQGSFRVTEGDAFLIYLATDGFPPGRYAVAFSSNGQYADTAYANVSALPTPTIAPSVPGAAQFKAQATAQIDAVYPYLRDIITGCPATTATFCAAKNTDGRDAYGRMMAYFYGPAAPAPCNDLYERVLRALSQGNNALRPLGLPANIPSSESVTRAQQAVSWLDQAKYLLVYEPGACR